MRLTVSGVGTGTLAPVSGSIQFGTGIVKFYNPSYTNEIATFSVFGGSGTINPTGIPNGESTLIAKAVSFDMGYFFKDVNGVQGADYSTIDLNIQDVFGFSTTNLRMVTPTAGILSTIADAFPSGSEGFVASGATNSTLGGPGTPYTQLYLSGNGQYSMEIPEPESLALFGAGLLALAASRRRKTAK